MNRIQTYQVYPSIPKPLLFLETLSRNLWWSWKPDACELFRRIDPQLWDRTGHNPIRLLAEASQKRLENLAQDDSFLAHQQRVKDRFEHRVAYAVDWPQTVYGQEAAIAYFSMEFAIHESLRLFAGGLGVLAGDHLKAASNMALPLVGVSLLYRNGYFRQFLDHEGWQQESYPETELYHLPVERVRDLSGNEITVSIVGPEGIIHAGVWRIRVGRVPLFLLDTNLPENSVGAREVTARLYADEPRIRLAQEVLLGVGGVRALAAMGIFPKVCHMNEGHSAFSCFERLAMIMSSQGVDLATAREIVPRASVFTTHTPVAAGHDAFSRDLIRPCLAPFQERLGIPVQEMIAWGLPDDAGPDAPFSMFILGVRMAQYVNGVSRLHGRTARRMWAHLWPGLPENEVPVSHVTNGIHVSTWISAEIARLFERHLGPEWYMSSRKPVNIDRVDGIYDEELWRAHELNRTDLIRHCRRMMVRQYERRNAPRATISEIEGVLDPDALTIAFARRFATYKRALLLFHDPDRLSAILNVPNRPVQIVFAGKAHPRDALGKEIIKKLIANLRDPRFRNRIVFIENYGMDLARKLVQGADVWLNTPIRPNEACGTSGMKAAANGVLNVSILDGWWCEGFTQETGWAIGGDESIEDDGYRDSVESQALYNLLENEVVPAFYEQKNGELPQRWIRMMKASIKMAMRDYCSLRMVGEYESRFYAPAVRRLPNLLSDGAAMARQLASRHRRLAAEWPAISLSMPTQRLRGPYRVGDSFEISVSVKTGGLKEEELDVELYYGHMRSVDDLDGIGTIRMTLAEVDESGEHLYRCTVPCRTSGRYGFTVRVTPCGDAWLKYRPSFIAWA